MQMWLLPTTLQLGPFDDGATVHYMLTEGVLCGETDHPRMMVHACNYWEGVTCEECLAMRDVA